MNPININRAKPSHTAAANPPASNAVPSQANPIAPQAGSLHSQQGSEKKERSIQSASGQISPRVFEEKLKEDPMTRLRNARNIQNPEERDVVLLEIAKDGKTTYDQRNAAIRALSSQEKRDEVWIARATDPELGRYDRIRAARNISAAHGLIKDEVLLEIAKARNTPYAERNAAIEALSSQEKRDEVWIARATDLNLDVYSRISAARNISAAHGLIKDEVLLEIAKARNTPYAERNAVIEALSSQEKRDEVWIARATDPELGRYDRIRAARNISAAHGLIKDEVLLEIAKARNTPYAERNAAIEALSSQEKRDEVWIARATDLNLDIIDRINAARNISAAHGLIKDEVLLEIAKARNTPYAERNAVIEALSSQEKQDEAWIARATNPELAIIDRIGAAIHISVADNTILRNKVLIELYNEALNRGQERARLERIVDAIQDPHLQAVAREALEAGGPVRLGSTKSARNIRE